MSVLDRDSLQASPLADLHLIASELGIDSFRRLRKADLVNVIIERQGGGGGDGDSAEDGDSAQSASAADAGSDDKAAGEDEPAEEDSTAEGDDAPKRRRRRGGRGRRSSGQARADVKD